MVIYRFYILNVVTIVLGIALSLQVNGDADTAPISQSETDPNLHEHPQHEHQHELKAPENNLTNASSNSNSTDDQPKPSLGSNVANYLEACGPNVLPCNNLKDLICDNLICKCKSDEKDPDGKHAYGKGSEKCLPIAAPRNNWACSDDDNSQCTESRYGNLSRCNRVAGVCECYDTTYAGREVILSEFDNSCHIKKKLDESCTSNLQCNATIAGEAVCLGATEGKTGICKCAENYQWEEEFQECLKLGKLNSDCKSDFQCTHEKALGHLSVCKKESSKCVCYDVPGNNARKTGYKDGRCHYSAKKNEACTEKVQCELGYHGDAICQPHPSFNNEKVCQCPEGHTCKSPASSAVASNMIIVFSLMNYIYFN